MGRYETLAAQLRTQLKSDQSRPDDLLASAARLREEFHARYGSLSGNILVVFPRGREAEASI